MRMIGSGLLVAVWAAAGCVTLPTLTEQKASPPAPAAAAPGRPVPLPVTPGEISDSNAREKAADLAEELERDERSIPSRAPAAPASKDP